MEPTPTPLIRNGKYRIVNVQSNNDQDGDLLCGQLTSCLGGIIKNDDLKNTVWNLVNGGNGKNQVTLTNAAATKISACIQAAEIGALVHGGSDATLWTIMRASAPDQYWILARSAVSEAVPIGLVWNLGGESDLGGIKILPIKLDDTDQLWNFVRVSD